MKNFKHLFWFQFPAIAWAIAIFVQSSLSSIQTPDLGFDFQDKLAHALEYAILGFLLRRALVFQSNKQIQKYANGITLVAGSLYAISDEIHQSFVPGRHADIGDAIADVVGIMFVVAIYFCLRKIKKWRSKRSLSELKLPA